MEIASLIIEILSLVATISVSFSIYHLQNKIQKRTDKENILREESMRKADLENRARFFLYDNIDEKDYLPLCQVAVNLHMLEKHERKIYNEYCKCEVSLQKEILRQANIPDLKLPEKIEVNTEDGYLTFDIETNGLSIFEKEVEKSKLLTTSFFNETDYKVWKYFKRGFTNYSKMRINGNFYKDRENKIQNTYYFDNKCYSISCGYDKEFEKDKYYSRTESYEMTRRITDFKNMQTDNLEEKKRYHKQCLSADRMFSECPETRYAYRIPTNFSEFEKMHSILPLDNYLLKCINGSESELCYMTMLIVKEGTLWIEKKDASKDRDIRLDVLEAFIETNEDLYYDALYCLYCCFDKEINYEYEKIKKSKLI